MHKKCYLSMKTHNGLNINMEKYILQNVKATETAESILMSEEGVFKTRKWEEILHKNKRPFPQ